MAMGDSSSGQSEWSQFYQRNTPSGGSNSGLVFSSDPPMTESTVVTTTATSASTLTAGAGGGDRAQPVSEGRVGKARRRSRASRKAPTTVLNTDTTNFRAMVQQFTGVPTVPFSGGTYPQIAEVRAGGGPATLSFGLPRDAAQLHQRPAGIPFGALQHQPPQFQQHHERPLFTLGGSGGDGGDRGHLYLRPGFSGSPENVAMGASEGLLLESLPPSQMMSRPAASSGSSTTNRLLL